MALYGVLGDIHGNKEALAAVLGALEARGVEQLLCVGDVIGYNADSDACALLLRACGALSIAGNHDLIGTRRLGFERCSNAARYALARTRRRLGAETARWLREQPATRLVEGTLALVHGGVRDVQFYMKTPAHIARNDQLLREDMPGARVCFFGHSHEQKLYEIDEGRVADLSVALQKTMLKREARYFINPGSVDAQRKHGRRFAECALFDTGQWSVEYVRVPYDEARTEAKAAAAGYRINRFYEMLYNVQKRIKRITPAIFSSSLRPGRAPARR